MCIRLRDITQQINNYSHEHAQREQLSLFYCTDHVQ